MKTLDLYEVKMNYNTGLHQNTTRIMDRVIVESNESAERYIKEKIEYYNGVTKEFHKKDIYPKLCTRDNFKKEKIRFTEGIIYDSLMMTHPEYFI